MKHEWIDKLARSIDQSFTRRGIVASVLGAVGAASLGADFNAALVKKRKKKRKKKPNKKDEPCGDDEARCGAACINTNHDIANCGRCGVRCQAGEACCAGHCRATHNDTENCGACGDTCAAGTICGNGTCGVSCGDGVCPADREEPDCCAGICTNVRRDQNHCGGCDVACDPAERCCNGDCVDPTNDRDHCGACGASCRQGEICLDGRCEVECGAAGICRADSQKPDCCDEQCVNTDRDRIHCGACGHACAETERCWNGVCVCGDVCHNGCQFSDIQTAIDAADPWETVRVCAGTFNGAITNDKSLTLVGAGNGNQGTFLQGRNGVSAVTVNRGDAEVRGFTISGGQAHQFGGGVDNAANLTLVDCTVSHNWALWGGGIANLGFGQLVLRNCTIEHNEASREGGGIQNSSRLEMTDCVIRNNEAPRGGGLYNFSGRQAIVTDSDIRENTAGDRGGGIFNGGTLTLAGSSTVTGNDAGTDGGGIFNDPATNGAVQRDETASIHDNLPNDCANTEACSA